MDIFLCFTSEKKQQSLTVRAGDIFLRLHPTPVLSQSLSPSCCRCDNVIV